jgi:hypothetical protein
MGEEMGRKRRGRSGGGRVGREEKGRVVTKKRRLTAYPEPSNPLEPSPPVSHTPH